MTHNRSADHSTGIPQQLEVVRYLGDAFVQNTTDSQHQIWVSNGTSDCQSPMLGLLHHTHCVAWGNDRIANRNSYTIHVKLISAHGEHWAPWLCVLSWSTGSCGHCRAMCVHTWPLASLGNSHPSNKQYGRVIGSGSRYGQGCGLLWPVTAWRNYWINLLSKMDSSGLWLWLVESHSMPFHPCKIHDIPRLQPHFLYNAAP